MEKMCNHMEEIDKRLERNELNSGFSMRSAPSAHSSPKPKRPASHSSRDKRILPSPEELRSDSRIQAAVERRSRQLNSQLRDNESGMSHSKPLKSGRYRLGDQRVKCVIPWPQESVPLDEDFKSPAYEDLSIFQWTQGYALNIYYEKDDLIRENMLLHMASVMQDAEELNWKTAKRAHAN